MSITTNRRAIAALAMVAIMVLGVFATPALAAAPSVSDGTDTGAPTDSTSGLNDGDTITYNASTNTTLTYQADSANSSVTILQNGTELETFENGTAEEMEFVGTDDANDHYIDFTLADDESGYEGIEADPGETVTLTYQITNDTTLDNPDTFNVTVNWDNHENKSFDRYESGDVETADAGLWQSYTAGIPLIGATNLSSTPAQAEADVGVAGADTETVTVYVADGDAQDALAATHESAGDSGLSWFGTAAVDGSLVPVIASGEDGPDWVDTDERTYLTVNEAGDEVIVHNAGDTLGDDTESATLSTIGAEQANIGQIWSLTGDYDASYTQRLSAFTAGEFAVGGDQFEIGE